MLGSGPVIGLFMLPTLFTRAMPPWAVLLDRGESAGDQRRRGRGVAPVRNPADETFCVMKPPPLAKKSASRWRASEVRALYGQAVSVV